MYSREGAAVVARAEAAAARPGGVVMRDRQRFAPFFAAAERFADERGLVVAGPSATLLLCCRDEPWGPEDYHYEFFSTRPIPDARALADALFGVDPEGLGRLVHVRTEVPGREYVIDVDERPLFRLIAISDRVATSLVPSRRPARFARAPGLPGPAGPEAAGAPLVLAVSGPELQLVETYTAFCDPSRAEEWPRLLEIERALRESLLKEIHEKVRITTGGRERKHKKSSADRLITLLEREYLTNDNRARIDFRDGGDGGAPRRLRAVAEGPLPEEAVAIARVAERAGFAVEHRINPARLPTDPALHRLTVYLLPGDKGRRRPVIDVYNAAEYSLVPLEAAPRRAAGARRTTLPAVMRFLLTEIWTMAMVHHAGGASAEFTARRLRSLAGAYERAAGEFDKKIVAGDFAALFPVSAADYLGRYIDPGVARKRLRAEAFQVAKATAKAAAKATAKAARSRPHGLVTYFPACRAAAIPRA